MTEESKVTMINMKTEEAINFKKRYYNSVYILLQFNKQDGFNRKEYQTDMEANPDKAKM